MRNALIAIGVGMFSAFAATPSASAMPIAAAVSRAEVTDLIQVRHRLRRHVRPHFVVRPDAAYAYGYPYGYPHFYSDYYATYRGFEDPGFAVRGNLPGCAVDLGYGRWESCDK